MHTTVRRSSGPTRNGQAREQRSPLQLSRNSDTIVEATADDWLRLLLCVDRAPHALFSYPDHSSPVHGAVLIAKPNQTLYEEGIELLRRTAASGPFNASAGWDHLGPPHGAVPQADHIWRRRRGHTHLVDQDNWGFVGGDVDQGFFFHMLRVRHALGVDLRLTECAEDDAPRRAVEPTVEPTAAAPPPPLRARIPEMRGVEDTQWFHYGASGGEKPDGTLRRWLWLEKGHMVHRAKLIPYVGENPEIILRALLWVKRTALEISFLKRQLQSKGVEAAPYVFTARAQLGRCAAALDAGLGCVSRFVATHPDEVISLQSVPFQRAHRRRMRLADVVHGFTHHSLAVRNASLLNVPLLLGGEHGILTRGINLLASSRKLRGPYQEMPRAREDAGK